MLPEVVERVRSRSDTEPVNHRIDVESDLEKNWAEVVAPLSKLSFVNKTNFKQNDFINLDGKITITS